MNRDFTIESSKCTKGMFGYEIIRFSPFSDPLRHEKLYNITNEIRFWSCFFSPPSNRSMNKFYLIACIYLYCCKCFAVESEIKVHSHVEVMCHLWDKKIV